MKTLGGGKTIQHQQRQPSWDLNWREREVFERWVGGKISTPVLLSVISVLSAQCDDKAGQSTIWRVGQKHFSLDEHWDNYNFQY